MTAEPMWRKSTFSGQDGNCVEVCKLDDGVLVRNSNHPDAGTLYLTKEQFAAFKDGCAAGEFDDLA